MSNPLYIMLEEWQLVEAQGGGVETLVVDSDITLIDTDSSTLSGAEVRLSDVHNTINEELLAVTTQGGIAASYAEDNGNYVLTLTGNASLADYEQVLESLTYQNIASDISVGQRTISIAVTDDDGALSAVQSVSINVSNDAVNYIGGTGSSDTISGTTNDDVLEGFVGDDILFGDLGDDTLYGGSGADTFVFGGVTSVDTVADFDVSEGDVLDIADLLSGYDSLNDAITDFVQITDNGTDTTLSVDINGGADNFVTIATLLNATGLTDEVALETSGNLIAV